MKQQKHLLCRAFYQGICRTNMSISYSTMVCCTSHFLNFQKKIVSQVIPCYIRKFFLKRHACSIIQRKTVKSYMKTEEGFKFTVDVTNVRGMTYVHGSAWKELARVYGFHVGQKLIFNIDQEGPRVRLTIGNWPRLHPSNFLFYTCQIKQMSSFKCFKPLHSAFVGYYGLTKKKRQIVDKS